MFKSIDKKLEEIGFEKIQDDDYVVYYERYNKKYNYMQVLEICHKQSGRHIIQSYDKDFLIQKILEIVE